MRSHDPILDQLARHPDYLILSPNPPSDDDSQDMESPFTMLKYDPNAYTRASHLLAMAAGMALMGVITVGVFLFVFLIAGVDLR